MYEFIFRNKFMALLFAGVTLLGVANLVGTQDEAGLLQQGVSTFEGEQAKLSGDVDRLGDRGRQSTPVVLSAEPDEMQNADFYGDEDLIDNAEGFDPTPDIGDYAPSQDGEIIGTVISAPSRPSRSGHAVAGSPENGQIPAKDAARLESMLANGR